jgi:hypothetical protein
VTEPASSAVLCGVWCEGEGGLWRECYWGKRRGGVPLVPCVPCRASEHNQPSAAQTQIESEGGVLGGNKGTRAGRE